MGAFIDKTLETFELMAIAITELRQRVEALEQTRPLGERPLTEVRVDQWGRLEAVPEDGPAFTMPVHRTLDESDRSHVISVGESHYHL